MPACSCTPQFVSNPVSIRQMGLTNRLPSKSVAPNTDCQTPTSIPRRHIRTYVWSMIHPKAFTRSLLQVHGSHRTGEAAKFRLSCLSAHDVPVIISARLVPTYSPLDLPC